MMILCNLPSPIRALLSSLPLPHLGVSVDHLRVHPGLLLLLPDHEKVLDQLLVSLAGLGLLGDLSVGGRGWGGGRV